MNSTDTNNTTDAEVYDASIASTLIKIASQAMLNSTYAEMSLEDRCNQLNETETHPGILSYLSSEDKNCADVVDYDNMEVLIKGFVNRSVVEGEFVHGVFLSEVVRAYSEEMQQRIDYINDSNGFTPPLDHRVFEDLYFLASDFVCANKEYSFVCGTAYDAIVKAEEIMDQLSAQNQNIVAAEEIMGQLSAQNHTL